jgi:hypothetical protein
LAERATAAWIGVAGATAGAARAGRADADGSRGTRAHRRSTAQLRRTEEVDRRVECEWTEDDRAQENDREKACSQADGSQEDRGEEAGWA